MSAPQVSQRACLTPAKFKWCTCSKANLCDKGFAECNPLCPTGRSLKAASSLCTALFSGNRFGCCGTEALSRPVGSNTGFRNKAYDGWIGNAYAEERLSLQSKPSAFTQVGSRPAFEDPEWGEGLGRKSAGGRQVGQLRPRRWPEKLQAEPGFWEGCGRVQQKPRGSMPSAARGRELARLQAWYQGRYQSYQCH